MNALGDRIRPIAQLHRETVNRASIQSFKHDAEKQSGGHTTTDNSSVPQLTGNPTYQKALKHKNDVDSSAMTSQHFEDLVKKALAGLPLQLQQQAAGVVTVIMCDPPPHAPKESLVAIVQAPTHVRLEVYKNNFDEGTIEEVLEKLRSVLADEFSFYFDS